jgi:hypothetical protein
MAFVVTHATVAVGQETGDGEIGKAEWNEAHTVQGSYETPADVEAATISAGVLALRTDGYTSVGDGGHGFYKRMSAAPSDPTNPAYIRSVDRYTSAGATDATNGGYWQLVPEMNEVHIAQFGGFADFDGSTPGTATDLYGPITYALAYYAWDLTLAVKFPYRIHLGFGRYYSSAMWDIHRHVHIVGTNLQETWGTEVYWPNTTTCILISQNNTSGETGVSGGAHLGAGNDTTLEGFAIRHHYAVGSFSHLVYSAQHGIHARAICRFINMSVARIAGHGYLIHGSSGSGGSEEGAPNQWRIRDCTVHSCGGHALCVYGADSNAGDCAGFSTHTEVGGCGIYDNSYFANTYTGIHLAGYGNRGVYYGGRRYILISGSPVENPTTTPNTTTPGTNNAVWYDIGPGVELATYWPAWDAGGDYSLYRLPIYDTGGGRVYTGVYVELSNAVAHVLPGSFVFGGTIAVTNYSVGYVGSTNAGLAARGGVGGRYVPIASSAEYTRNGENTWVSLGTPHESNGMGATGGIQFLTSRRVSDVDGSWQWGFEGNDIPFRAPGGAKIWEITTLSTTREHGTGATDPHRLRLFNPVFVTDDSDNEQGAIGFSALAPTLNPHAKAEVLFRTTPLAGGSGNAVGWICTTAGTPGTWKPFGPIMGAIETTVSDPLLNLVQTWNDGAVTFTGLKADFTSTASAANSIMLDLQIGGSSKWKVDKDGDTTQTGTATIVSGTAATAGGAVMVSMTSGAVGIYVGSGAPSASAAKGSLYLRTDGSGTSDRMYVNTDAGTTWTAVTTAA